jgi:hypothetical protein
MMPHVTRPILILPFLMLASSAFAQLPGLPSNPYVPPDALGVYHPPAPGPITAQMEIINNCDWDQHVSASLSTIDPISVDVPAHSTVITAIRMYETRKRSGSPGTADSFSFTLSHSTERVFNGRKQFCRTASRPVTLKWIFEAPADGVGGGPSVLEPLVATLEQREDGAPPERYFEPPRATPRELPFKPVAADRVCPPCQSIADAIALFEGLRRDLERQLSEVDERLSLLQREQALDDRAGAEKSTQRVLDIREAGFEANYLKVEMAAIDQEIAALRARLDDCVQACSAAGPIASAAGFAPVVTTLAPGAKCAECQEIAELLVAAQDKVVVLERQLWEGITGRRRPGSQAVQSGEYQAALRTVDLLRHQLEVCNMRCVAVPTTTVSAVPATPAAPAAPPTASTPRVNTTVIGPEHAPAGGGEGPDPNDPGCGDDCVPFDSCTAGVCGSIPAPGGPDDAFQQVGAETPRIRIDVTTIKGATGPRRELNPLGLLSRSLAEFMEWWSPTLHAAEQNLQKGLQLLITSAGGSTGKNLTMQVLNFTGKAVDLQGMVALEPVKKDSQQQMNQAFAKLAGRQIASRFDLSAYCLEFLKLPPVAGQVLRVAGPEVQKRFAPMKRIMTAANRLTSTNALKPDTAPASYADSIKQWAIWTAEQRFNEKRFGAAFMSHTKKNVEGAGQKWSKQFEDVVRQRTPNRWNDIVQILKGAGASVPQ